MVVTESDSIFEMSYSELKEKELEWLNQIKAMEKMIDGMKKDLNCIIEMQKKMLTMIEKEKI